MALIDRHPYDVEFFRRQREGTDEALREEWQERQDFLAEYESYVPCD